MVNSRCVKKQFTLFPGDTTYLTGLILVTAATLAWSTAGLFTRLIPLDSWTLLLWRGIFGAVAIAIAGVLINGNQSLHEYFRLGIAGWLFAIVSGVGMVCFITALTLSTVAHVSIIYATVPLVTAGLAWLYLREKPAKNAITASVAALAGVGIMVGVGGEGHWLGNLLAVCMTVCLALMMIISRKVPGIPFLPAAAVSALLSSAMAFPLSQTASIEPNHWVLLFLFGVVNSALGLCLFILGARYLPPIETALITALDAPLAPLIVWLVFSEIPAVSTLIGGAVVFVAVARYLVASSQSRDSLAKS